MLQILPVPVCVMMLQKRQAALQSQLMGGRHSCQPVESLWCGGSALPHLPPPLGPLHFLLLCYLVTRCLPDFLSALLALGPQCCVVPAQPLLHLQLPGKAAQGGKVGRPGQAVRLQA